MKKHRPLNINFWFNILIPVMLSFIVSYFLDDMDIYYESLDKIIALPSIVFALVWPPLYVLMGYAAYRVEKKAGEMALKPYFGQLILSLLWPIIFFGFKNSLAALIDMVLLVMLVLYTVIKFFRYDKKSGFLLLPYAAWLFLALALNISIVALN